jgi:gluconolactonase
LVSDQFGFTEGPASDTAGNVYFTDVPNNTIYKYSTDGLLSVFMDSVPCNGLAFDINENLIVCGHNGGRNIFSIDIKSNKITELTTQFEGKKFNSPNDLWIDANNGIYFTDPRYGNRDNMELETEQVYYVSPDRKSVLKVTDDLVKPNGVYGIEKGKKLLVADHGAGKVYVYNIKKDGTLSGKKLFLDNENVDGITVDELGNIYITSTDVKIYNKNGFLIEVVKTSESPTNVSFGGKDFKTLFITERKKVYSLKMNVKGNRY